MSSSERYSLNDAMFDASDQLRDLEGIPNRIPDHAAAALKRIAAKLRVGEALTDRERVVLAEALERAASNPRGAAAALGLKQGRSRGRLKQANIDRVALVVSELHFGQGIPLKDGTNAPMGGALAQAAERLGMKESTVRDAWSRASARYRVERK